ncbi:MAG: cysteine hydrolase [Candidatus Diapherotrites archaeon]|nr:cysteine hydrolase [Candidatus Diapherotrites archaeon]
MKTAVIVIDMLNDFVTGRLKCERAKLIVPNLQKLLSIARQNNVPVIYACDAHSEDDFELKLWGPHAMKGTKGAEIIPELKPEKGDYVIEKKTYSAFFGTKLHELLQKIGVKELILTGIHTHVCVQHTAADAFFRGYKVVVVQDCVQAFDEKSHRDSLEYMKTNYGAKIKSSDAVIEEWVSNL